MTSTQPTLAANALGRAIDQHRGEIERRWLERVQRDVIKTPGVELTQLRDAMPHYLLALAALLRHAGASGRNAREVSSDDREVMMATAHDTWSQVAREHGVTGVRIGFDIDQLVHEFIVLRRTIRDVAFADIAEPELEHAEALLADIVEAAIAAAVQAYVEARDYDMRRTQAHNIAFLIHELRSPLSAGILALSELRSTASPDQGRALATVERSLRRLNELIDSVLLTERLEAGEMQVQPVELELGRLLRAALDGARALAERKGLDFRVACDPALRVQVDPRLTSSAIQNLADNAVKYTDAGVVEVSVESTDHDVTVHVRDDCHGLSSEELRTIFEPFRRGRTRKTGTGLGLAIARRAVEMQGGRIHAESPGPSGCHFWLTLPRRVQRARS